MLSARVRLQQRRIGKRGGACGQGKKTKGRRTVAPASLCLSLCHHYGLRPHVGYASVELMNVSCVWPLPSALMVSSSFVP